MYRVSKNWDRVCIDIHGTRRFRVSVPNSASFSSQFSPMLSNLGCSSHVFVFFIQSFWLFLSYQFSLVDSKIDSSLIIINNLIRISAVLNFK